MQPGVIQLAVFIWGKLIAEECVQLLFLEVQERSTQRQGSSSTVKNVKKNKTKTQTKQKNVMMTLQTEGQTRPVVAFQLRNPGTPSTFNV